MEKVFVDTNIIIDFLAKREPFVQSATEIFSLADDQVIEIGISSLSYSNAFYILKKDYQKKDVIERLNKVYSITNTLNVNSKIIQLALNADFKDFEDAIQYYTATEGKANLIVTRNIKDFIKSEIPVLTPEDYIKTKMYK